MTQELDKRYSFEDLKLLATKIPYGTIVLNMDKRPVIFKHPYEEEILIIGYKPGTDEISFAQTIEHLGSSVENNIKWDPINVVARWANFQKPSFEKIVSLKRTSTKLFFQSFMFLNGYVWENGSMGLRMLDKNNNELTYVSLFTSTIDGARVMKETSSSYNIAFVNFWNSYFNFK